MAGTVGGHVFGLQRPSAGRDYTVNGKQIRDTHFRDLPAPKAFLSARRGVRS
jgi:hypothetical protein